jgi:hypothetical protein
VQLFYFLLPFSALAQASWAAFGYTQAKLLAQASGFIP